MMKWLGGRGMGDYNQSADLSLSPVTHKVEGEN